ncbi:protein of unknown function [Candidatus Nitrosocosmicus franklandus]|uniref:Uncharacterized protein n=1 Tax=Candidatus Nitrosocosmicus franklandianus TaxID=1798806 RepID=A0A484I6S7_9ARCH|nr:protein of unknown function [Candidatus Nitrosocosmicus franklandus]
MLLTSCTKLSFEMLLPILNNLFNMRQIHLKINWYKSKTKYMHGIDDETKRSIFLILLKV